MAAATTTATDVLVAVAFAVAVTIVVIVGGEHRHDRQVVRVDLRVRLRHDVS